jgi:hypothetical protein
MFTHGDPPGAFAAPSALHNILFLRAAGLPSEPNSVSEHSSTIAIAQRRSKPPKRFFFVSLHGYRASTATLEKCV